MQLANIAKFNTLKSLPSSIHYYHYMTKVITIPSSVIASSNTKTRKGQQDLNIASCCCWFCFLPFVGACHKRHKFLINSSVKIHRKHKRQSDKFFLLLLVLAMSRSQTGPPCSQWKHVDWMSAIRQPDSQPLALDCMSLHVLPGSQWL